MLRQARAMKIMDLEGNAERLILAQNETDILKRLDHENIVKYFDHFEIVTRNNFKRKEKRFCIITEFCEVLINYFILFKCLYISLIFFYKKERRLEGTNRKKSEHE